MFFSQQEPNQPKKSWRLVSGTVALPGFFDRLLAVEIPPALGLKNVPSLASKAYEEL